VTRLAGSGRVPLVFASAVAVVVTVFVGAWYLVDLTGAVPKSAVILIVVLLALRSVFVGVFIDGDDVVVRGWFRDYRYGPGDLTKVTTVPYWAFLGKTDPILSFLKFTPVSGWVREVSATVSWKDRTSAHAAAIRRHLGIEDAP
jgi:hypothetical protein